MRVSFDLSSETDEFRTLAEIAARERRSIPEQCAIIVEGYLREHVMGRVRRCQECGTQFAVSDERQRYCPPADGQTESRCGHRARMRRLRAKQYAGRDDGVHQDD